MAHERYYDQKFNKTDRLIIERFTEDSMNTLQNLKDGLAKDLYDMTTTEAQEKGICVKCKRRAPERCYSDAGRREYQISGLCEICFDNICS